MRNYQRYLNEHVRDDCNKLKQCISVFKDIICIVEVNLFEISHLLLFNNWRKDPYFNEKRILFPSAVGAIIGSKSTVTFSIGVTPDRTLIILSIS